MRGYADGDEVDIVIVGCGAGGATLLQRLARAGWPAVALEAGPFWDPERDWVSDEAGSHHLYWTEPRMIAGTDPVPLGSKNSGRGVGGSMVHFAGYTPRFHPSDFHTFSADGVGRRLAAGLRGPAALLRGPRRGAAGGRRALALGRSPRLPAPAASGLGQRRAVPARGPGLRHHREGGAGGHRQRALRQPAALHLPGLLPAGLQGQRQGLPADHPCAGRPGPRGRDPGRSHGDRNRLRRANRPGDRRRSTSATASKGSSAPGWSPSPAIRSKRRGCC